ncbi:hypothetical protein [Pulveribacter sp.]|uniref:hypothetical protein n=1 Tax=Pulveribacter sp. TaxID=2678893 RepID=UPI00289AB359|nr:hypothetical protein [Pulveribacter sp.]
MALRRPLALIAGLFRELPVGDAVPVEAGGTGATTAAGARDALGVREKLTAPRTYYVRTDGNDGNTGLSNSSGGAFATIQKAIDVAASFDLNGFAVTIQIADGTYAEALVLRQAIGDGVIVIRGNLSAPANVVLNSVAGTSISTKHTVEGVSLSQGSAVIRLSSVRSDIAYGAVVFGSASYAHVAATAAGRTSAIGPVTIAGSAPAHVYAGTGGSAEMRSSAVTLTGTPMFATGFAHAQILGAVLADGNTFSGSGTGPRYAAALNGIVFVGGAGATYLPGSATGTLATGGQYA